MTVTSENMKFVVVAGYTFILILSFFAVTYNEKIFSTGQHNIDRGWNLKLLNDVYNMSFVELAMNDISGKQRILNDTESILLGNNQMRVAFEYNKVLWLILGMVFGVILMHFTLRDLKEGKRK